MDSKGMHIRDRVVLTQALATALRKGSGTTRYIAAREIVFGTEEVEFIGQDLVLVADTIRRGGDHKFVARARPLPPRIQAPGSPPPPATGAEGKPGSNGPRIEIFCKHFDAVRIQSVGAQGGTGEKGKTGDPAISACTLLPKQGNSGPKLVCEDPVPSPKGKRGGRGGPGGSGGQILLHYVSKSGDGLLEGIGAAGGAGGEGGRGGKITQRVVDEDGSVSTKDPNKSGSQGDQGLPGATGANVAAVRTQVGEDALWQKVRGIAGGDLARQWAQHRFKQAEYFFRTYRPDGQASANLGLAKQEFDRVATLLTGIAVGPAADPFDPTPAELVGLAARQGQFIVQNQNVYGMPRNLYLIPYVDNELQDLQPYEALPQLFRQDMLTTLLKANDLNLFASYLQIQIDALTQATLPTGSLALEEAAASQVASAATQARDELVNRASQLRSKLEGLRQQVHFEKEADSGMIIPGVRNIKLFAIVASTILTVALPPAAVGTAGLVAATLAPQLPDLLLGQGSPTEQSIQGLIGSGVALGQTLVPYLQNLENTAAGLKQYAELYEQQLDATGDPDKALTALTDRLKKDFGKDIKEAERFALDFKKLRSDLASAKPGPDKPAQTEFLAVARELASVAQQAQQAILTAQQANMAHQVALSRKSEAETHAAALKTLKATVSEQGFVLRKATEQTLRRAQKTLSILMSFQFRLVRALDLYTLERYRGNAKYVQGPDSAMVRYDFGFVSPDIMADYGESAANDVAPANALLSAVNASFDLHDVTLSVRDAWRKYRLDRGGRSSDISESVVFAQGSPELERFRKDGRVAFRIALEDLPFAYEAKVQNVKVILSGVTSANGSPTVLNLVVRRPGATEHRWHPDRKVEPPQFTQWLSPGPEFSGKDILTVSQAGTDGSAASTFRGETKVNEDVDKRIKLQCFGTGVAGDWTLELLETADLPRIAGIARLEFIVSYGGWVAAEAPVVESIVHPVEVLLRGARVMATLTLAQAPKTKPAAITLTSSQPAALGMQGVVTVPVGVRQVQFPITVGDVVPGSVIRLGASGANVRSTDVFVPSKPALIREDVPLAPKDTNQYSVNGLVARNGRIYATLGRVPLSKAPGDNQDNGTLIELQRIRSGWELASRVAVGHQPRSLDIYQNGGGGIACVVNGGQNSYNLSVIDLNGKAPTGRPTPIAIGPGPIDVAIVPGGKKAYVSNWSSNLLHEVDLVSMSQQPLQLLGPARKGPMGIAVDAGGELLFVAATYRSDPASTPVHELIAVDLVTRKVASVTVGPDPSQPFDVATFFDPSGKRHLVFVGLLGGATVPPGVAVFEARRTSSAPTLAAITPQPIRTTAGAKAVAADGARGLVYAAAGDGVDVIDARRFSVVAHVTTGPSPISVAVEPESGDVWIGDGVEGKATRIAALPATVERRWD